MARMDKMKISKSLQEEWGRDELSQEELENKYFKNNVDKTKTHLNYRLIDDNRTMQQMIDDRLQGVYVRQIKGQEPIKAFSVVCTLPQGEYTPQEEQEFFEQSLKFLQERYGSKNVLQGFVHKDESQPHAHFIVCPIVEIDKSFKGAHYEEKLCCKEVLTPLEYKTFHSDYQDYLSQHCAGEYKVVSDACYLGYDSTSTSLDDLKSEQKKSNYEKLQQENKALKQAYKSVKQECGDLRVANLHIQQQAYEREKEHSVELQDKDKIIREQAKVINEWKQAYQREYDENHKLDKYTAKENEWADDWDLRR